MPVSLRVITPVATLAIVLALSLTACGSDDSGARPATPAPGATEGPTPVLEGVGAEFRNLLLQGLNATYKVTYRITTDQGIRSVTVYNSPPLTRIHSTEPDGTESILIGGDRDIRPIACSDGPDEWRCAEIERLGDSLLRAAGPTLFLEPATLVQFQIDEREGRTIAGQETRCFLLTWEPPEGAEEPADVLEYCLTPQGVPLYNAPVFGTVEAVEFSAQVSDGDFAPPAWPEERRD